MDHLVKSLDEIQSGDAPYVGGKAFNCAKLKQAGFPVPDGIVLGTEAMEASLEIPALQAWLASLPKDVLLAVRSSATDEDDSRHSFAGIHETRLNVAPADVSDAVRTVWNSVTAQPALAYRLAQNLPAEHPRTAVLIQRMIQPVAAGVAFTVNPVTGSRDELVINSVFGPGDSLVSGQVDPDEFRMRKADGEILSSILRNNPPSLTVDQLRELRALLSRIEQHYGSAQDVEWCYDGSQFWIVQSRPVTTRLASPKQHTWTRANAREVLADLASPMTVFAVADMIEQSERRFYGRLLAPESELGRVADVFYGRLYFNVDQMRYTCRMTGVPVAVILRSLGHAGPIGAEDEVVQRASVRETIRVLPDIFRVTAAQILAGRRVRALSIRTVRVAEEMQLLNLRGLSDTDLWAENRKWRPRLVEEMQVVFTLAAVSTYERPLQWICARTGMSYERLAYTHLAAGEKSVSSAQAFDLLYLARIARDEKKTRSYFAERKNSFDDYRKELRDTEFLNQFDLFLKRYGHRGHYESDLAWPRYKEDPSPLLFTIQSHVESPQAPDPANIIKRQSMEAVNVWKEFKSKLHWWQRTTFAPLARWLLRRIKQIYVWRELCRSDLVRVAFPLRLLHLEMARRFVERGWITSPDDYFFLTLTEVDAVVDNPNTGYSLASLVDRRKNEWQGFARIPMPLLMKESDLPAIVRGITVPVAPNTSATEWRGLCVSPGCVEGEVVVIHNPDEFSRMKRGAILVTVATDPSWTPLFTLASGIIVEVGGILSHASTIAREYGLPALANLKSATKIFKDGDRIRLDATNGVVQLL